MKLRKVDEKKYANTGNNEAIFWSDVYDGRMGYSYYGHQAFKRLKLTNLLW